MPSILEGILNLLILLSHQLKVFLLAKINLDYLLTLLDSSMISSPLGSQEPRLLSEGISEETSLLISPSLMIRSHFKSPYLALELGDRIGRSSHCFCQNSEETNQHPERSSMPDCITFPVSISPGSNSQYALKTRKTRMPPCISQPPLNLDWGYMTGSDQ